MIRLYALLLTYLIQAAIAAEPATVSYCKTLHPSCGAGRWFIVALANGVVNMISTVIGGVAVLAVIWGSIRIIASGGNDEGRNQGKQIITAALVGVFLALVGKAFVFFVAKFVDEMTTDVLG